MKSIVNAVLVALALAFPVAAVADTTGSLTGHVRDVAGVPLAGVTVRISSPAQVAETTSDAKGRYCFVGLVPETYIVSIQKFGYMPMSFPGVAVEAGGQAVADVRFQQRALRVVSLDFARPRGLMRFGETADVYSIRPSNSLLATSRTIGELLPFVPGVQVIGGSPYPR